MIDMVTMASLHAGSVLRRIKNIFVLVILVPRETLRCETAQGAAACYVARCCDARNNIHWCAVTPKRALVYPRQIADHTKHRWPPLTL
jgi:hypothetical protein